MSTTDKRNRNRREQRNVMINVGPMMKMTFLTRDSMNTALIIMTLMSLND